LGALTALSVAMYSAHRQTQATEPGNNHHSIKPERQARPEGELVLLGLDGTVIAREINLAPHAPLANIAADIVPPVRVNHSGRLGLATTSHIGEGPVRC
jgi:hypothetical protein